MRWIAPAFCLALAVKCHPISPPSIDNSPSASYASGLARDYDVDDATYTLLDEVKENKPDLDTFGAWVKQTNGKRDMEGQNKIKETEKKIEEAQTKIEIVKANDDAETKKLEAQKDKLVRLKTIRINAQKTIIIKLDQVQHGDKSKQKLTKSGLRLAKKLSNIYEEGKKAEAKKLKAERLVAKEMELFRQLKQEFAERLVTVSDEDVAMAVEMSKRVRRPNFGEMVFGLSCMALPFTPLCISMMKQPTRFGNFGIGYGLKANETMDLGNGRMFTIKEKWAPGMSEDRKPDFGNIIWPEKRPHFVFSKNDTGLAMGGDKADLDSQKDETARDSDKDKTPLGSEKDEPASNSDKDKTILDSGEKAEDKAASNSVKEPASDLE